MTGFKKVMRGVKYGMLGLGAISVLLCLLYNVFQYGVHGVIILVFCLVPTALAGLSIKMGGMPRWASAVSMVSFWIVGMKTSGNVSDLNNIMMAVFFASFMALALLIAPDRPKKPKQALQPGQPPQGYPGAPQQGYAEGQPQPGYPAPQQGYAEGQAPQGAPLQPPPAGYDPNGKPQS